MSAKTEPDRLNESQAALTSALHTYQTAIIDRVTAVVMGFQETLLAEQQKRQRETDREIDRMTVVVMSFQETLLAEQQKRQRETDHEVAQLRTEIAALRDEIHSLTALLGRPG